MAKVNKSNWWSKETAEISEVLNELKDKLSEIKMVYVSDSSGKHKYIRFDIEHETQKSENQGNLNGA